MGMGATAGTLKTVSTGTVLSQQGSVTAFANGLGPGFGAETNDAGATTLTAQTLTDNEGAGARPTSKEQADVRLPAVSDAQA